MGNETSEGSVASGSGRGDATATTCGGSPARQCCGTCLNARTETPSNERWETELWCVALNMLGQTIGQVCRTWGSGCGKYAARGSLVAVDPFLAALSDYDRARDAHRRDWDDETEKAMHVARAALLRVAGHTPRSETVQPGSTALDATGPDAPGRSAKSAVSVPPSDAGRETT